MTFKELNDLYEECKVSNWDGYDAFPIEEKTKLLTEELLKSLPEDIPVPDISADPDGQISLEWYYSPNKLLSFSVDPKGFLHYASTCNYERKHGTIVLNSNDLIDIVREFIK